MELPVWKLVRYRRDSKSNFEVLFYFCRPQWKSVSFACGRQYSGLYEQICDKLCTTRHDFQIVRLSYKWHLFQFYSVISTSRTVLWIEEGLQLHWKATISNCRSLFLRLHNFCWFRWIHHRRVLWWMQHNLRSKLAAKLANFWKDMYGGRYIVAIGIGMSGFIGMFQPLFVKWGVNWFITVRFLQGLAQGLTFTSQFRFESFSSLC